MQRMLKTRVLGPVMAVLLCGRCAYACVHSEAQPPPGDAGESRRFPKLAGVLPWSV